MKNQNYYNITPSCLMGLSHLGLLKVSGVKAKDLLQGQLTCDLNEVTPTESRLGAHCNPQGRIISLFQLFYFQNDYYLQMPRSMIPIALQALKKYAVFFKVELSDASDAWEKVGYHGDDLNVSSDVLIIPFPGQRYEIIGSHANIEIIKQKYPRVLPENAWDYLNIQHSIATIYPETSEKFLPHDINLPHLGGVSFKKGCYTGQEIIARMQYRGKLKNHLYLTSYTGESVLTRGESIIDDQGISGELVDYVRLSEYENKLLILTLNC